MNTRKLLYASWLVSIVAVALAVVVTWTVVRVSLKRQHSMELKKVTEAKKLTSQAYWIAWHNCDIPKENEDLVTVRTLILLFEKRQLLDEASQLVELEPNSLYAGQVLHSIGVDTAEEYFLFAEEVMDNMTSSYEKLGVPGVIFPGREIHESDDFNQFIEMSILQPASERLILYGD